METQRRRWVKPLIVAAKLINPAIKVFVRARYIKERAWLEEVGVTQVCTEEAETALGLAMLLGLRMRGRGTGEAQAPRDSGPYQLSADRESNPAKLACDASAVSSM